ncbi:STAS domain-containing protein [Fibrobacterota bacterium]
MQNITLRSKLTFKQVNQFVNEISSLVGSGEKSININMESCHYFNSIMLSGLIRSLKTCENAGCRMVLLKVSASVMTLFETTNVRSLFTIEGEETKKDSLSDLNLSFKKLSGKKGVFILKGSLNSYVQCSQLREFYEKYILEINSGILDCTGLEHLGSPGVTEMFRLRGMLQEKSGILVIVGQTDSVESIWRMMHLESLIPRVNSLEDAQKLLEKE